MKKKLLVFHPIIAPYRIDLFNTLAEHYDCKVILYWRNLKDQTFDYTKLEEQMTFKPTYIIREELGTFKWIKALCHELKNEKPDLVMVIEFGFNTIIALLYRLLALRKYKVVCITDDSYNILSADNHFTGRHKKAISLMAPMIDEFINVEPRSAQWYQDHFNKGIYFPIIADDKAVRKRLKRVLPISERYIEEYNLLGKKVFLFVGRLVGFKNIDFAIKTFAKANIKDSVFVIVGSGDKEELLRSLCVGIDNILMVGRFEGDELYAWYNVAQVFTLPSTLEPFGAVTNEALVAGCQSLISKDAGSNCLIKDDVNGFVIDPHNEELYMHYLRRLMYAAAPLALPLNVKPNIMNISFKEAVEDLIIKIDKIL